MWRSKPVVAAALTAVVGAAGCGSEPTLATASFTNECEAAVELLVESPNWRLAPIVVDPGETEVIRVTWSSLSVRGSYYGVANRTGGPFYIALDRVGDDGVTPRGDYSLWGDRCALVEAPYDPADWERSAG